MNECPNKKSESDEIFFVRYSKYKDFLMMSMRQISLATFLRMKVTIPFVAILKCFDTLRLYFGEAKKMYSTNVHVFAVMSGNTTIKRFQYIFADIERRGYTVKVESIRSHRRSLLKWIFYPVAPCIPNSLRLHFKYVEWLLQSYNPKVVIITQHSGLLPGILRRQLNERGGYVVNLAHGVGYRGIKHCSTDTDYLFVFGQSTIDGKRKNTDRIGSTCAVKVGSPFIYGQMTSEQHNAVAIDKQYILIASQWLPNYSSLKNDIYKSRQIISDLVTQSKKQDFLVKLHPHEDDGYWQKLSEKMANLKVLSKEITLLQALKSASICLHMSSNASIEAGVLKVPSIAVDATGRSSFLLHEKYMPVIRTTEELIQSIELIVNNYKSYQTKASEYAHFHLEYFFGAGIRIANNIVILLKGNKITNGIPIKDPLTF